MYEWVHVIKKVKFTLVSKLWPKRYETLNTVKLSTTHRSLVCYYSFLFHSYKYVWVCVIMFLLVFVYFSVTVCMSAYKCICGRVFVKIFIQTFFWHTVEKKNLKTILKFLKTLFSYFLVSIALKKIQTDIFVLKKRKLKES